MLIKVEAINIYAFVNDAQNLSAVRGGGLMLLEMPEKFSKWLQQYGDVKTLTQGASKAVFRLKPKQEKLGVKDVETKARSWLRESYEHATIGLAVLDAEPQGFFAADEALTTAIRSQQMHSFSIAGLSKAEGEGVCALDHVRPGTERITAKGAQLLVSQSAEVRHEYGRVAKQSFLQDHSGVGGAWEYTRDMDELSEWPHAGDLDHKVAVFYADGNSFTKLLWEALRSEAPARQEKVIGSFDAFLQGKRKEFLAGLFNKTTDLRWKTPDGKRRVEVLLWGGDELMLVVPAWCGWQVAESFCEVMKGAIFRDGQVKIPLKHGMGLIFAHHKAPIHALTRLVRDLAEEAKADRKLDRLSYLVLESFDHIGEDLERFRELRCPVPAVREAMVLSAEDSALAQIQTAIQKLKDSEFPRRKVFQAVLGMARGDDWRILRQDIEPFLKLWEAPLADWKKWTGGEEASWYHLAELWDYVGVDL